MLYLLLAAIVGIDARYLYEGIRDKKVKFALKRVVNSWRVVVHLVFVLYSVIGSVSLLPSIMKWSSEFPTESEQTLRVLGYTPYVWVAFTMLLTFWVVGKSFEPWIKYTPDESLWLKKEKEDVRNKLPKQLKWLIK